MSLLEMRQAVALWNRCHPWAKVPFEWCEEAYMALERHNHLLANGHVELAQAAAWDHSEFAVRIPEELFEMLFHPEEHQR